MTDVVNCAISDGIAIFTLNRPEKLNAINFEVIETLLALLDTIERDPEVNAVIVTGAGRAFSAGADIAEFSTVVAQGTVTALREFVRRGQRLTARLENYPKPIIAAVNGLAFGGGCEITEAMHLAVASEHASFAKPEINLGFPPPFGGTQRLPRLVGRKRGLELLLTGDPISAETAQSIGLVNRVVPHAELLDAAKGLARRIMEKSPLAVAATLGAVTRGLNVSIDEGLAIEAMHFGLVAPTEDIREGISAFLAKRPARFIGR
ncbi:crotonase/enoyl-CoA hydratase family protein [Rhodoblastus sp.]|jgi:enoyl-CoA hydratase/carnithine racemase|uniref:crotonase/enoyl-CoA hydratase family protein n=1 Tax=Rhodoblastus sp. TaxID=1962975 RepID=UPI0025D5AC4E|nr:crotonase/enoyl-CoA hydratase family protein [Rhodoblastus sp.]